MLVDWSHEFNNSAYCYNTKMLVAGAHSTDYANLYYVSETTLEGLCYSSSLLEYLLTDFNNHGIENSFWSDSDIEGIIVDNGIIVGVKAKKFLYGICNLFPGEAINTYSACDEDGTGVRDRDDYLRIEIK